MTFNDGCRTQCFTFNVAVYYAGQDGLSLESVDKILIIQMKTYRVAVYNYAVQGGSNFCVCR